MSKNNTPTPTPTDVLATAEAAHAAAVSTLDSHMALLDRERNRLGDLQSRPLDVTGQELAAARGEIERLELASPILEQAVSAARAELRFALGASLSETLPEHVDPTGLTASIDAERDKISASLRKIARLVGDWNNTVEGVIRQCEEVGLVEGECDPMSPIYAAADGGLMVHDQKRTRFNKSGTVVARLEQAAQKAGHNLSVVTA